MSCSDSQSDANDRGREPFSAIRKSDLLVGISLFLIRKSDSLRAFRFSWSGKAIPCERFALLIRKSDFLVSISLFLVRKRDFLVSVSLFLVRKSDFLVSVSLFLPRKHVGRPCWGHASRCSRSSAPRGACGVQRLSGIVGASQSRISLGDSGEFGDSSKLLVRTARDSVEHINESSSEFLGRDSSRFPQLPST